MRVTVRADGGPNRGFGHLIRTGAIAAGFLSREDEVTYHTRSPDAVRKVCPPAVEVVTLSEETPDRAYASRLDADPPDLALTDSYEADTAIQRAVTGRVPVHAVVVDDARHDLHATHAINGNVYAHAVEYGWTGSEPTWLLGPEYLPIRREIRARRDAPTFCDPPERLLVTMGGSDIGDATPTVVRALDGLDLEVTVVVGPGFTNRDRIAAAAAAVDAAVDVRVDPPDLPAMMADADLAVSAAGSTVYELLALGTPSVVIPQAPNQRPIAEALAERGVVDRLPPDRPDAIRDRVRGLATDADRRRRYHEQGRRLVDCRGAERIRDALVEAAA